jgi:ABC-type nitrate/sulfonate/bicarbonate transport system permease component
LKETAPSKSLLLGALGMLIFAAAWEVIGSYHLAGLSWPPLSTVLLYLTDPGRTPLFLRAASATLGAVAIGYAIGCTAGLLLAVLTHIVSLLRPGTDRTMAVVHAIPSIALGPLFIVLLGREATPIAIATLNVLFAIYVATSSGLASASPAHRDVMRVLGASLRRQLCHLDMPAAFPAIVTAMKLAVPAALIGAIIGEWFGAPRGLGLLILNAMQNFQVPLLWSAVLLTALVSLSIYGALTLLERFAYERFR